MPNATDNLVTALRAAGLVVGDGESKGADGTPLIGRYVVVWPISELPPDGPISNMSLDRAVDLQITSCGPTRRAADQVAEKARSVALGPIAEPTGYAWLCPAEYVVGAPTTRETPANPNQPELYTYYRADQYRYHFTPASVGTRS